MTTEVHPANGYPEKDVGGRPLKFQSVDELQTQIDAYFAETPKDEWTWTGLALFLDCEKETLKSYRERDGFSAPLKKALLRVEQGYEVDLKKHGRAGSIFALKNFEWKDKNETDVTSGGEKITGVGVHFVHGAPNTDTPSI